MRLVPPSQSCLLCVPLSSFKAWGRLACGFPERFAANVRGKRWRIYRTPYMDAVPGNSSSEPVARNSRGGRIRDSNRLFCTGLASFLSNVGGSQRENHDELHVGQRNRDCHIWCRNPESLVARLIPSHMSECC
jgi:hypothetical protein